MGGGGTDDSAQESAGGWAEVSDMPGPAASGDSASNQILILIN